MAEKILVIDDEETTVQLIAILLERRGYEVIKAFRAEDGLRKAYRYQPDLVLLDIMMPDMDGWEVYQQIKAEESSKDIPVIIVTAKAQNIDRVLGLHIAKVNDYIAKPFTPQELLHSIEKILKPGD